MNDQSKTLIALLAGLAAGAALGILFAPEKGTDTRDQLSDSLSKLSQSIQETLGTELEGLAGLKDNVFKAIKDKLNIADEEVQDDLEHA